VSKILKQLIEGSSDWFFIIHQDGHFDFVSRSLFTLQKKDLQKEGLDLLEYLLDITNKRILAKELRAIFNGGQIRIFSLKIMNLELKEPADFVARAWPIGENAVALQLTNQSRIVKREKVLAMKENEIDLLMNSFFKKRPQLVDSQYYQKLLRSLMTAVESDMAEIYVQEQQSSDLQPIASIQENYLANKFLIQDSALLSGDRTNLLINEQIRSINKNLESDIQSLVVCPIKLAGYKNGFLITGSVDKFNFNWTKIRLLNKASLALSNLLSIDIVYWERQKIEKMKDQFLSLVSHELRSPITVIKGNLSLIKDETTHQERVEYLKIVDRNLDRLNRLVDDILEVTRLQYGGVKFNITKFNLQKCLLDFVKENRKILESNQTKIILDAEDIMVANDIDRINQILANLLSNSLKNISKQKLKIEISVRKKGSEVEMVFADNGVGINEVQLSEIFNRFYKVTEIKPGAGLGLAIVKELLTKMKGSIEVESVVGEGTQFIIHFPLKI